MVSDENAFDYDEALLKNDDRRTSKRHTFHQKLASEDSDEEKREYQKPKPRPSYDDYDEEAEAIKKPKSSKYVRRNIKPGRKRDESKEFGRGRKRNLVRSIQIGVSLSLPLYEKFQDLAKRFQDENHGEYVSVSKLVRQAAIEKYFPKVSIQESVEQND